MIAWRGERLGAGVRRYVPENKAIAQRHQGKMTEVCITINSP
jgi:hypothetical protein